MGAHSPTSLRKDRARTGRYHGFPDAPLERPPHRVNSLCGASSNQLLGIRMSLCGGRPFVDKGRGSGADFRDRRSVSGPRMGRWVDMYV